MFQEGKKFIRYFNKGDLIKKKIGEIGVGGLEQLKEDIEVIQR